ncbi:DUF4156 domain-containing protein [Sulfuritalea hydrogenivorans]|uniref:Uncharacterized protein n=1 Tax=Sulfuritalea hydrogenivorans sk43H TaxID=1223802 RepID=W0SE11_9PROT|nr:DUF4156 domain-containing protein [Sulfuritalea hydrogenivorans]BAO27978.1 hypothetical protein SUTH_00158 [Sulfuritalea hydrogenivorans sk43H]
MNKLFTIAMIAVALHATPSRAQLFNEDISEATHVLNGNQQYSPISESQVQIFVSRPTVPFTVIGTIEARGMAVQSIGDALTLSMPTEKDDMKLAIAALRKEAASIGANGVVIVKQGQVRTGSSSTERRIAAAAIRY